MKKKTKKKIIWTVLASLLALFLVVALAVWAAMEFYFLPKVNENIPTESKITTAEALDLAKYFADPDILETIKNFDKETVAGMVSVIEEIEKEMGEEPPKKTPKPTKQPETSEKSAYDKIMESATEEEIKNGMAVIKKINMAEANKRYREGGIKALKRYVITTLSKSDLDTAVELYRKYEDLL